MFVREKKGNNEQIQGDRDTQMKPEGQTRQFWLDLKQACSTIVETLPPSVGNGVLKLFHIDYI